jgi:hypothetical protein
MTAAHNSFKAFRPTPIDPIDRWFEITPSDETPDLPFVTRQIRATGAGVVSLLTAKDAADGKDPVLVPVGAYGTIDSYVAQVFADGTTATGLVGGY